MAPLLESNTARFWYDYVTRSNGIEHTVMLRTPTGSGTDATDADAAMLAFVQAIGVANFTQGWRFIRARYAVKDVSFSLPRPLSAGLAGFVGTSTQSFAADREALEFRFVGRSALSGRRGALSIYGLRGNIPLSDFRIDVSEGSEGAIVQSAVNSLNGGVTNVWVAIDGTKLTWYPYLNVKYNAYWQRRIRIGG